MRFTGIVNVPEGQGSVLDHFGFTVDDVAGAVERAREKGAQVLAEPYAGISATMVAMIEDPWGIKIQLIEEPEYPGFITCI
jgi:predicted enzyme related to lactoylglutathione lyase